MVSGRSKLPWLSARLSARLGPAWQNIAGNHRIREQKKIAFSYSDPGGTLENNLNDLKPLFSRKKSLTFQKRSKKMFLHWRANLADQNKQQPLKMNIRVTYHTVLSVWNKPLIDTACQHCSTSRANQALRSLMANAGFQNRGVLSASVSFLPLPLPLPLLSFFGSCFISRAAKTENPVPRSKPWPRTLNTHRIKPYHVSSGGQESKYQIDVWQRK